MQTALIPLAFAAAAGCVLRYGRSSADGRHQIKWFAFAGSVTAAGMLVLGLPGGWHDRRRTDPPDRGS